MRNMVSWLFVHLAILFSGRLCHNDFYSVALTAVADILSHGRCEVLMCTASAERT
jgi:hypothetical protein